MTLEAIYIVGLSPVWQHVHHRLICHLTHPVWKEESKMRVLVRGGTGFIGSHLCNDSTKEVAYVLEMRDGGSSDKSANHVALSQQELSKA